MNYNSTFLWKCIFKKDILAKFVQKVQTVRVFLSSRWTSGSITWSMIQKYWQEILTLILKTWVCGIFHFICDIYQKNDMEYGIPDCINFSHHCFCFLLWWYCCCSIYYLQYLNISLSFYYLGWNFSLMNSWNMSHHICPLIKRFVTNVTPE